MSQQGVHLFGCRTAGKDEREAPQPPGALSSRGRYDLGPAGRQCVGVVADLDGWLWHRTAPKFASQGTCNHTDDPGGIAGISRGSSEATPPVRDAQSSPDPKGVAATVNSQLVHESP